MATLSILGLMNLTPTLFDGLKLPTGMDKPRFLDELCSECAELCVLYPNGELMQRLIKSWSETRAPMWQRIKDALDAEFNPIENYDRYEEWKDSTRAHSEGSTETRSRIAGFNDPAPVDAENSTGSSTGDTTGNAERLGHTHGNIGVTTAAQMIKEVVELYGGFDIYQIIVREFKRRFLITVY